VYATIVIIIVLNILANRKQTLATNVRQLTLSQKLPSAMFPSRIMEPAKSKNSTLGQENPERDDPPL